MAASRQAEVLAGGFAENSRAGIQQSGGNGGVVEGDEAFQRRGAVHHWYASQRDVVLEHHGAAGQFTGCCTCHLGLVIPGIKLVFVAFRTIAGGAWVVHRGDLVGQGVNEIIGVEIGLHQRQIFFGLCRRQSYV